jgi:hypothetical protein
MKLGSWLHSIPRLRIWRGSFRVEYLGPLEMREMNFSTRRMEWPRERERERERERAVEIVGIFIKFSLETSRWTRI